MFAQKYNFHLYLHFAHLLEERLRTRLAPFGIHSRQARVIGILGMKGQASQAVLAREFGLTAASMSSMASRLLTAGLIERQVDPREHRSKVLKLTQLGYDLLEQIHQQWKEIDRECTGVIGEENTAQFAELSSQLRNAFGGTTPGAESSDENSTALSKSAQ